MTSKIQEHINNGYPFSIGDHLSKGWKVLSLNMGGFIGFTAIYILIVGFLNFIPFIGMLINIAISPCLIAGFYLMCRSLETSGNSDFGIFFKGFDHLSKVVVIYLIQLVIYILAAIPLIIMIVGVGLGASVLEDKDAMVTAMTAGGAIYTLLFLMGVFIYLAVSWCLSIPLAIFHNMEAWQALETSRKLVGKNWFLFFLLFFLLGLIQFVGLIALCLGLLITIPLIYTTIYSAYKEASGIDEEDHDNPNRAIDEIQIG